MCPIAVIINNLGFGGAERLVVDEVNEMHRRRMPVILITLRPEREAGTFMQSCTIPPAQRHHIPFASLFDIHGYLKLVFLLRREKIGAVVTHLWFSNTIGRIACFFARTPRVISFEHNVYDRVKTHRQFLLIGYCKYFPRTLSRYRRLCVTRLSLTVSRQVALLL